MEQNKTTELVYSSTVKQEVADSNTILAKIISVILHPLFMAVYGVALLFIYTDFKYIFIKQIDKFISPVFIFSCLIPGISLILLKKLGYISSYSLDKKEERLIPFATTFLSYLLLFVYFQRAGLYTWFLSILIVPLLLLIICGAINRYWKVSAHMTGIGGLIGSVFSVCYNIKGLNPYSLFIILIILAGALGVARLILNKHTPAQVYIGFLIGFIISYITVYIGGYYPILFLYNNLLH